jgi:hypothetical protein
MLAPPTAAVAARAPATKRWHITCAGPCRRALKRRTLVTVQHFGMSSIHAGTLGTTVRRQQWLGSYGLTVCAFLGGLFG